VNGERGMNLREPCSRENSARLIQKLYQEKTPSLNDHAPCPYHDGWLLIAVGLGTGKTRGGWGVPQPPLVSIDDED
jgi:hypothetical protein